MRKSAFFILLIGICGALSAQEAAPFLYKWDPNFSFTWEATPRWSFNGTLGGLHRFAAPQAESGYDRQKLERIEMDVAASYAMFNQRSATFSYKLRRDGELDTAAEGFEHRFTEQFVFVNYVNAFRLAHRFRLEQRVKKSYENRLRYRLGTDVPLRGTQLDGGEFYLILSEELVFSFNAAMAELENRVNLGLGYKPESGPKMEVGGEYRQPFGGGSPALHIFTAFYFKI